MKKVFSIAAILWGMAALSTAYGIGRSGNGTIQSSVEGFEASAPVGFEITSKLSHDRLRLLSPEPLFGPGGVQPLLLELSSVRYSLTGMTELSRASLLEAMAEKGWLRSPHRDPCVEAFFYEPGMAVAAFWGDKRGLVVVGPASPQTKAAEMHLLETLTLLPGACAW